jgi:uncharacterized protein (DUF433 family)
MIDWSECPAVARRPGFLSGKPALRDDPRVSPETVVANIDAGVSAAEVIDLFTLRTTLPDVLAVYDYAKRQLAHAP